MGRTFSTTFSTRRGTQRIVFGRGTAELLGREIAALSPAPKKILVVATPGRRRDAEAIAASLGPLAMAVHAGAQEHVPEATVALGVAAAAAADAVLAFGGGS